MKEKMSQQEIEELLTKGAEYMESVFTKKINKEVHDAMQPVIAEMYALTQFYKYAGEAKDDPVFQLILALSGYDENTLSAFQVNVMKHVFQLGYNAGRNSVIYKEQE